MPRGPKPLIPEHLQDELVVLYQQENYTIDRLKQHLYIHYKIDCDNRTILRRLNSWGSRKRTVAVITDELINRVLILFFDTGLEDEDMLVVLNSEFKGQLEITKDILIRLRFRLGLRRRIGRGKEAREQADKIALELVARELARNPIIDGFGKVYLATHFRQQHMIIARDRLFQAYRLLNPVAVDRRKRDLQRHKGDYVVPGPNWCWSMDGHDKLKPYGIGIYACIDTYSRYVLWIYVGIGNTTQITVLQQYLDCLKLTKTQPRFIRTDRGVETTMMAGCHYELQLYKQADLKFNQCYLYGTSTGNIRIESWWQILSKGCLFRMRVSNYLCFRLMSSIHSRP